MSQAAPAPPAGPARFEEVLTTLEKTIAELAGGTAPLEELVAAHQRALVLLAEAQARLEELKARADTIGRQLG